MQIIWKIKFYLQIGGIAVLLRVLRAKMTNTVILQKVTRRDCKFPFQLRLNTSDSLVYLQVFINEDYGFIVKRQPSIIIDAGANIGLTAIYFANKYPQAKIIAIEPEQSNFEILEKNVASYSNIIALQAALWNRNEKIPLVDPDIGKWGFMVQKEIGDTDSPLFLESSLCHHVDAFTVDKIMEIYGIEQIDILKMDIEGAEKEVFSNASTWIDKVNSLIVELHERMKPGCNRSFYNGSNGFDNEWHQGENVYLSRENYITKRTTNFLLEPVRI